MYKIGDKLSDNRFGNEFGGNDVAWVADVKDTAIEVFVKAKTERGVDSKNWYAIDIFNRHFKKYKEVEIVTEKEDVKIYDNDEISVFIDAMVNDNAKEVERYRSGDKSALGFFMKNIMSETNGRFDKKFGKDYLMKMLN